MPADAIASYVSGAVGICIGNRLDILKTELQAGNRHFTSSSSSPPLLDPSSPLPSQLHRFTNLFRGAAAPILGYGALNTLLFMTYNRTLYALDPGIPDPTKLAGVSLDSIWVAGALGGLATWIVSAPNEVIKCRAQLLVNGQGSSCATFLDVWRRGGIRGFYVGGVVTAARDSVGYGFYFWSYELTKRLLLSRGPDPFAEPKAVDVLVAGGVAGVVTWASIYPLDAVKTRVQTQEVTGAGEAEGLLVGREVAPSRRSAWVVARDIARTEGVRGFYRGLGVCSLRACIVNAVQFFLYERIMGWLGPEKQR